MFYQPLTSRKGLSFLVFSFIFSTSVFAQSLSGNYTIGGPSADYASFRAAISALDSFGVSGPVVFNVQSGVYRESDTIKKIAHSSSVNTVTFQAASGDSSDVVLEWNSQYTGNWNLRLYRTGYLIFKNIGFRQTFDNGRQNVLLVDCHNITFENCLFEGSNMVFDGSLLSGTVDSNLTVKNCNFRYARKGVEIKGAKESKGGKIHFENNRFHTQHIGLRIQGANDLLVKGNLFQNITGGSYAGLVLRDAEHIRVYQNSFSAAMNSRGSAIDLHNIEGDSTQKSLVYNNVANISSSSARSSFAFKMGNAKHTVIAHNNFRLISDNSNQSTVGFFADSNGFEDCYFYNNVVTNTGTGATYMANENTAGLQNDYNLWFSGNGWITPEDSSLTALTAKDSSNGHSHFTDPLFRNSDTLYAESTIIDSNAFVFTDIRDDFEGKTRNASVPDIGAFELLHLPEINLPEDTLNCGSILLSALSNASWYDWSTGSNASEITVTNSGRYWFTAINGDGRNSDTVNVTIPQPPQFSIVTSADTLFPGQCVQLTVNSAIAPSGIIWSDSLGLIGNQSSIIVCPTYLPAKYLAEVQDSNGCSIRDSIILYPGGTDPTFSAMVSGNGTQGSAGQNATPGSANGGKKTATTSGATDSTSVNGILSRPHLYPNPATKMVFVLFDSPLAEIPKIQLSDLAGNFIPLSPLLETNSAGTYELNIRHLPSGSYLLIITTQENLYRLPIAKMKD